MISDVGVRCDHSFGADRVGRRRRWLGGIYCLVLPRLLRQRRLGRRMETEMSGANGKDKLMGGTAMDPFNPDAAAVERWKNRPKETVELPHTENKIMVTITTYDLVEEDGRYVPAAKMAELSREAILKEAKQSVADAMELHVAAAD